MSDTQTGPGNVPAGSQALGAPPERAKTLEPSGSAGGPQPVEREFTIQTRTQFQLIVRRFLRHRLAVASLIIFTLLVIASFVLLPFWKYKYNIFTDDNSVSPSWKHPFGTDETGYDAFAQVLRGTQRSVEIALFVALSSTIFGAIFGAIAGFYRGGVDSLLMRIVDVFLTFPIIAIAALLGNKVGPSASGWFFIAIVIAALTWPYVARLVRGVVLSLREKEFVEASRALGASDTRIIFRHLLPNAMGPIIVAVTILVATAILTETALSFIGFGVQPPDTSLGLLVSNAQTAVDTRPWLFYFPGAFIIIIALTINFIGDGLRDAFDPTQTRVRA
ncbi:MAG: ABC transporter permease [Actinomycetes bacterium]